MNKLVIFFVLVLALAITINIVSAEEVSSCCEKTKTGLFCQDAPSDQCDSSFRIVPSACASTSYCKQGTCYDSNEGTCLDNTPQNVCNANNGTWSEEFPAQCQLGCCILGDQAAFVTLVRCKKLASFFGLKTNYDQSVTDEVQCVLQANNQEKGACVYDFEFEKTCKFTTKSECLKGLDAGTKGDFYEDKLCSAEELGTNCGPTEKTSCVDGKDGVYFIDSCGNPANVYDASKVNDKDYWANVYKPDESCSSANSNANSKSCGNCNYLQGSVCREASKTNKPNYGEFVCQDLNCKSTSNGNSYKHGESWCVYNDEGKTNEGANSVGSRFFKHICINGEEVVEPCDDFRQQECIENNVEGISATYSQAACRANRWRDCTGQTEQDACENLDQRDCIWKEGITLNGANNESVNATCIPKNPPGLKFWEGEEAKTICAQASANCVVKFEKAEKFDFGSFNYEGDWKCKENCECVGMKRGEVVKNFNDLEVGKDWIDDRQNMCLAMGDCGVNVNWIGQTGNNKLKVNVTKTLTNSQTTTGSERFPNSDGSTIGTSAAGSTGNSNTGSNSFFNGGTGSG